MILGAKYKKINDTNIFFQLHNLNIPFSIDATNNGVGCDNILWLMASIHIYMYIIDINI